MGKELLKRVTLIVNGPVRHSHEHGQGPVKGFERTGAERNVIRQTPKRLQSS